MTTRALALGIALAAGCFPSSPDPVVEETTGMLGNGTFRWSCADASDPTCGTGVFPTAVALGSRFGLQYAPDDDLPDSLGSVAIEPIGSTRLGTSPTGGFEALLHGDASVVAMADGYVLDYISLRLLPVDDLTLGQSESTNPGPCDDVDYDGVCDGSGGVVTDGPVSLVVGEDVDLRARALGEGHDLAGALPYTWQVLTPSRLAITHASGRSARVTALAEGTAQILVSAGDFEEVFEYEVQPAPVEPEPEPEPESTGTGGETDGSDSDAGSASDSGSDSDSGGETEGATTTGGMQ